MKFEDDKIFHFLGIMILTMFVMFGSYVMIPSLLIAAVSSLTIAAAVSVGKEVWDSQPGGTGFSVDDLKADGLGFIVGFLIALGTLNI